MIRRTIKALAGLGDTPRRTAFAFAIGVFLGFSPLIGLQTLIGFGVALLFRLNRFALVIGTCVNLPLVMPLYYAFAAWIGHRLVGADGPLALPGVGSGELTSDAIWAGLARRDVLIAIVAGSMLLCSTLAAAAYPLALGAINRFRGIARQPVPPEAGAS